MAKSLGFPSFEIVDANGFSGGLWLLWDNSKFHIDIIGTTDQSISVCVRGAGYNPWLFTFIYASPCIAKRRKLWDYLNGVVDCHQMSWML